MCPNVAVIERPDGTSYTQPYQEFEDLLDLVASIGPDYLIVDIWRNDYL